MSSRFRRLTDLFVEGRTVTLPDGTHLYVRAINSYERDECVSDAQVARSRLILALKENGNERVKIEALLAEKGPDKLVDDLVELKADEKYPNVVAAIETDPEWSEKLTILRRTNFDEAAKPATPEEEQLVEKLWAEWYEELQRRLGEESDYIRVSMRRLSDEELLEEYLEAWLAKRGGELANAEYLLTETWYATRYCDAVEGPDGLDHARCEGHTQRVFASKAEARSIPDSLAKILREAIDELTLASRDPKDSPNPQSSSASSPPPSEAAASTPSSSVETLPQPLGT